MQVLKVMAAQKKGFMVLSKITAQFLSLQAEGVCVEGHCCRMQWAGPLPGYSAASAVICRVRIRIILGYRAEHSPNFPDDEKIKSLMMIEILNG